MSPELEQKDFQEKIDVVELLESRFNNIPENIFGIYRYVQVIAPETLYPTDRNISEDELRHFTTLHQNIYEPQSDEIVKQIVEGKSDVTVIGSGMYGGKSTLSFYILDKLKELEYETQIYIADVMNEDHVTGRSYQEGNVKRKAIRCGESNMDIELPKSDKSVVILDEFSFFPSLDIAKEFVRKCRENDTKVILLGLNTNYLGDNLDIFNHLEETVGQHNLIKLKSFVPGLDTDIPTGTKTTRFVNVRGHWIKDFGILPLVVSKELKRIVHYSAAKEEQTFEHLLRERKSLQQYVLQPNATLKYTQGVRLQQLEKEFGYRKA